MYLVRRVIRNSIHYCITQLYKKGDHYRHRNLLELGISPQKYKFIELANAYNDIIRSKR